MQNKSLLNWVVPLGMVVFLFVFSPYVVLADPGISGGGITNPLGGGPDQTITSVLKSIINWMLGLVSFIALAALISAGVRMIFGFLDEDQIKRAKTTILWSVIGLAVVILSYAIVNIVATEILGTSSGTSYDDGTSIPPNALP